MANQNYMNLKSRVQKQQKRKNRKIKIYHSFLTFVLLLCIIEMLYSALLNFTKLVADQAKIIKAQELLSKAEDRNHQLKNEIQNFSSMYKVEEIARNNLKMAAKDEVLIIINQPKQEDKKETNTYDNKFFKFFEDFTMKFNKDMTPDKVTD